jgi:hypothetical protein
MVRVVREGLQLQNIIGFVVGSPTSVRVDLEETLNEWLHQTFFTANRPLLRDVDSYFKVIPECFIPLRYYVSGLLDSI